LSPLVAAVGLGSVPFFGAPKTIVTVRVRAALLQAGVDAKMIVIVGSTKTSVSLKAQTVSQEQFVNAGIEAAQEKHGEMEAESGRPVEDLKAPQGELVLVAENITTSGNTVLVTVVAYVDAKRINSRSVKLFNTAVPMN